MTPYVFPSCIHKRYLWLRHNILWTSRFPLKNRVDDERSNAEDLSAEIVGFNGTLSALMNKNERDIIIYRFSYTFYFILHLRGGGGNLTWGVIHWWTVFARWTSPYTAVRVRGEVPKTFWMYAHIYPHRTPWCIITYSPAANIAYNNIVIP